MSLELTSSESEHERLRFLTHKYTSQPLGSGIAGMLLVLLGLAWLVGQPGFARQYHELLLLPVILVATYLLPRFVQHFYYEPKFGHVKSLTPEISNRQFWLIVSAAALFGIVLVPFVILPGLDRIEKTWSLEPVTFFVGGGFCVLGTLALTKDRRSFPWRFFSLGIPLIAFALLPVFDIQTKDQVQKGWFWIVMGLEGAVLGVRDHLLLVRELSAANSERIDG